MAATDYSPSVSNPKRPCWFYGKLTGCRYGNRCHYDHTISKTSVYGKLFGILDEILKNQNAIYKAIQHAQSNQIQPSTSSVCGHLFDPKGAAAFIQTESLSAAPDTAQEKNQRVKGNEIEMDMVIQPQQKPTASPKTKKKRKRKRKKKNSCQKKKNQQQLPRHPNDILSDISERNPSSSDDDDYPSPTDSDEYSTQSPSVTHNKSFDVDDNHSSTPPPNLKPKTTNMGGQLSSEDVAMDGVTAAAAPGGSKRHCECKEPQRIAVTAVQNPVVSQRVGPRQISQNPPSYSPPRYPKHPSHDKKKKKKTLTKKNALNPYARAFSKGELYDTGHKDTKCKDKMMDYPPLKARIKCKDDTTKVDHPHAQHNKTTDVVMIPQFTVDPNENYCSDIWYELEPNSLQSLSYVGQELYEYLRIYTAHCNFEKVIRRAHPLNIIGFILQNIFPYHNIGFCYPSGYDEGMETKDFAAILLAEYAKDLGKAKAIPLLNGMCDFQWLENLIRNMYAKMKSYNIKYDSMHETFGVSDTEDPIKPP